MHVLHIAIDPLSTMLFILLLIPSTRRAIAQMLLDLDKPAVPHVPFRG